MKELVNKETNRLDDDDIPEELDLDWSKAMPNPYVGKVRFTQTVTLDPDMAEVFTTAEAVNRALRAIIEAMPARAEEEAG